MPYLRPALVLDRFSRFVREDVRPAIGGEGDEFLEAQVGSLSSTLSFLSKELEGMGAAVETQHDVLLDALDDAKAVLREADADTEAVEDVIDSERARVVNAATAETYDHEEVLVDASSEVLKAVDTDLDEETARAAQEPLYRYLDTRVESQLRMLGREDR